MDNLTDEVYNFLIDKFNYAKQLEAGQLRNFSGTIVEDMIELIWNRISSLYPNIKAKIIRGSLKPYHIEDSCGNYIDESVDKHCYINDEMVLIIECKTYLDKCYMQRADSDFNLMKTYNKTFDSIIISLENAIADNSYNFFMGRGNIDKVYYLASGKRNSKKEKRIYNNPQRIEKELIKELIDGIHQYFLNYKGD